MARRKSKRDEGVSLLEVLVVLAIIALIMGLVAPRVAGYFGRAKSQAAEIQMTHIKGALQLMYIDIGRYPSEAEGLQPLLNAPAGVSNWRGPYLEGEDGLLDPWARPYIYELSDQGYGFVLKSLGRDGQAGGTTEDSDITLW